MQIVFLCTTEITKHCNGRVDISTTYTYIARANHARLHSALGHYIPNIYLNKARTPDTLTIAKTPPPISGRPRKSFRSAKYTTMSASYISLLIGMPSEFRRTRGWAYYIYFSRLLRAVADGHKRAAAALAMRELSVFLLCFFCCSCTINSSGCGVSRSASVPG